MIDAIEPLGACISSIQLLIGENRVIESYLAPRSRMLIIENRVFRSIIAPHTDGTGRRTNTQSTITLIALCTYELARRPLLIWEHLPVAIASAASNGIKPSLAHAKRTLKKNCKLAAQEKAIIA
jgi:hypothetical protein